jgi:Uma2 family endonuclease
VRWTVDEFHELACLPALEGRKLILVDGEVLDMPLANHPHDMGIGRTDRQLRQIFHEAHYWVRIQMALPLGLHTDPGPDIAVVAGEMTTNVEQPTTAILVVEVADSTLDYDIGDKADLYAAAGIGDYWVLDINGRQLLVFRDPIADAVSTTGYRYSTTRALSSADSISALVASQSSIRVSDLIV